MKTRKCTKCGAESTLKSTKCYNCGAPITVGGKLEQLIATVVILGVIGYIAFNYFFGS